jgi:hypothetical protein
MKIHKILSRAKLPALAVLALAVAVSAVMLCAQDSTNVSPPAAQTPAAESAVNNPNIFDAVAGQALAAMQKRAAELNVKGVAVVAGSEGDSVQSWSSKMVVVGNLKTGPSKNDPLGANLLAIAYAKAAEMADTLKASGSGVRPPIKGEFGWQGGVIAKGKTGWLIAAFSGGASPDDVKISQAGLDVLASAL